MRLDGVIPILSTPFDEDEQVEHGDLCRELDFLAGAGIETVGFGLGSAARTRD